MHVPSLRVTAAQWHVTGIVLIARGALTSLGTEWRESFPR